MALLDTSVIFIEKTTCITLYFTTKVLIYLLLYIIISSNIIWLMEMDSEVLVHGVGYFVVLFGCEILFLYCEVFMWIYATLWRILFSYLDFHNAKQSGILHSVDRKLKDASKKSVRNFSFVRIEYFWTNRGMIQNMRFLAKVGYWWKLC